jgi:hypothetical protein
MDYHLVNSALGTSEKSSGEGAYRRLPSQTRNSRLDHAGMLCLHWNDDPADDYHVSDGIGAFI